MINLTRLIDQPYVKMEDIPLIKWEITSLYAIEVGLVVNLFLILESPECVGAFYHNDIYVNDTNKLKAVLKDPSVLLELEESITDVIFKNQKNKFISLIEFQKLTMMEKCEAIEIPNYLSDRNIFLLLKKLKSTIDS